MKKHVVAAVLAAAPCGTALAAVPDFINGNALSISVDTGTEMVSWSLGNEVFDPDNGVAALTVGPTSTRVTYDSNDDDFGGFTTGPSAQLNPAFTDPVTGDTVPAIELVDSSNTVVATLFNVFLEVDSNPEVAFNASVFGNVANNGISLNGPTVSFDPVAPQPVFEADGFASFSVLDVVGSPAGVDFTPDAGGAYSALVGTDGATAATVFESLVDTPVTNPPNGFGTANDSFAGEAFGAVNNVISSSVQFDLSSGDLVNITSEFDVARIPSPGSAVLLASAVLLGVRRRR